MRLAPCKNYRMELISREPNHLKETQNYYLLGKGGYVFGGVGLSVCQFVCLFVVDNINQKVMNGLSSERNPELLPPWQRRLCFWWRWSVSLSVCSVVQFVCLSVCLWTTLLKKL